MDGTASFRVGELEVIPLSDGNVKLPPQYFLNSDWSAHQALIGPDGMVDSPLGCFVVRTGAQTVLVDAGVGPFDNPIFQGGLLPERLVTAGVARDDVDVVVCTHLHLDHTGWLVQEGSPFFPNATVRFGAGDWEQFVVGGDGPDWVRDALAVLEARGRLAPIDGDGLSLAPGVTSRLAPGHTQGHQCLVLASGEERVVLLGDAVTCPVQLEEADWLAISDVDQQLAARTREALWKELETTGDLAVAAHFPDLRFGRILPGRGKRYFVVPEGPPP